MSGPVPPPPDRTGSSCTEPGCNCAAFASNLYRPALCVSCYHSIAEHYPGLWNLVNDVESARVFYEHAQTKTRLYARPYDPKAASAVLRPLDDVEEEGYEARRLAESSLLPYSGDHSSGSGAPARSAPRVKSTSAGPTMSSPDATASPDVMRSVQLAPGPPPSASSGTLLLPADCPTAVPQSALANLSINLSLLSSAPIPEAATTMQTAVSSKAAAVITGSTPLVASDEMLLAVTSAPASVSSADAAPSPHPLAPAAVSVTASEPPLASSDSSTPGATAFAGAAEAAPPSLLPPAAAPASEGRSEEGRPSATPPSLGEGVGLHSDGSAARDTSAAAPPAMEVVSPGVTIADIPAVLPSPPLSSGALPRATAAAPPSAAAVSSFLQPLFEDPLVVGVDAAAFQPGGHE